MKDRLNDTSFRYLIYQIIDRDLTQQMMEMPIHTNFRYIIQQMIDRLIDTGFMDILRRFRYILIGFGYILTGFSYILIGSRYIIKCCMYMRHRLEIYILTGI
jgi:hypothetical protein